VDLENNIICNTIPTCNERNIIPPTLQQAYNRSGDIASNRNSQNMDRNADSGYIKKDSTRAMEKQQSLNVENKDNW
jgi:hypothetical protein